MTVGLFMTITSPQNLLEIDSTSPVHFPRNEYILHLLQIKSLFELFAKPYHQVCFS
jgi:hypothetical protein